jgi:hypothetical protein
LPRAPRGLWHRRIAWLAAALLFAAMLADLAGGRVAPPAIWTAAYYAQAAGLLVGALVAAPLGIIDAWRAPRLLHATALHIAAVAAALLLHLLAWLLRAHPRIPPDPGVLIVEGVATLCLAGAALAGLKVRRSVVPR